jgi:hypothetical protein
MRRPEKQRHCPDRGCRAKRATHRGDMLPVVIHRLPTGRTGSEKGCVRDAHKGLILRLVPSVYVRW